MTVRLTHRQKPDTQDYIFQALGNTFALTGIAASIRKGWRMVVPDKIPYIYTGFSASVSKLPPVWGAMSAYSITEGAATEAQALPVSVPGGGSPTITVAWHSSSVPSTKPAWVTLTSGTAPTIAFTGAQVDANDVSSMVLSAVANGSSPVLSTGVSITVSAAPSVGLNFTYTANEGAASTDGTVNGPRPRLQYGEMFWESWYATKDGTLIEYSDGNHGFTPNRVGEWNPTTGAMTEVFPNNNSTFGAWGYDNYIYEYFDAVDSLIVFPAGQYDRSIRNSTTTANGRVWRRIGNQTTVQGVKPLGASVEDRPPLITASSTGVDALIYSTNYDIFGVYHSQYFNAHVAYSKQFDCCVIIGGGAGSDSETHYDLSVILPSSLVSSSIQPRYTAYTKRCSEATTLVGGVTYMSNQGRSACVFLDNYVYWWGGEKNGVFNARLWRANILPVLQNPTADLQTTFLPQRLSDLPAGSGNFGTLSADPYSQTLLLFSKYGIHCYDVTTDTWSSINAQAGDYGSYWSGSGYPVCMHADFVDTVAATGAVKRRTYWVGGNVGSTSDPNYNDKLVKVRSMKVTRGLAPTTINITAEDPTNTSATFGTGGHGPFRSGKHFGVIESYVSGLTADADKKITLFSGDWSDAFPYNQRADYPPAPYWSDDGRQEMWDAAIDATTLASGTLRFKLAQNAYHNYPWNGSTGYSGAGGFGGVEPQRGPFMPDGLGFIIDKRGQHWMGPCTDAYDQNRFSEVAGETCDVFGANQNTTTLPTYTLKWAPMYQWTKPGLHGNGIRLGNGWTRPNQTRIKSPGLGGQPGTDFDVGIASDSEFLGLGRPNTSAYDPVTDAIYVVGINGTSTQTTVILYKFPCVPTGGVHTWTRTPLTPITLKSIGLPNATSVPMNYGDRAGSGTISNTVYCNGKIYFTFVTGYTVPSGYGNATDTFRKIAWILSVDLRNGNAVGWLPFPEAMNWWVRNHDGPYSRLGQDAGVYPGTVAQYRSMKAVNNKLVLGPDAYHKVATDPWICVYDTVTGTWKLWEPPANYAITNGGHDWPHSWMNFAAVPSLGEAWSLGQGALGGSFGDAEDTFRITYGLHRPNAFEQSSGQWVGRRAIRFKVD